MDREAKKKLVLNWSRNDELIEALHIYELRRDGPVKAIRSLEDVNRASINRYPPKPTSGLIEMQRLFAKLRKK